MKNPNLQINLVCNLNDEAWTASIQDPQDPNLVHSKWSFQAIKAVTDLLHMLGEMGIEDLAQTKAILEEEDCSTSP